MLRVLLADVLEDEGYDHKGVWIVRGDAQVAVDMQEAQLQSVDEKTKKLVVILPPPRVIQPRVDHEKSRVFDVQNKTTWILLVGDRDELTNQGWTKAQRVRRKRMLGNESIDQARAQTEFVLANMYRLVGWDVDWQDGWRRRPPRSSERPNGRPLTWQRPLNNGFDTDKMRPASYARQDEARPASSCGSSQTR